MAVACTVSVTEPGTLAYVLSSLEGGRVQDSQLLAHVCEAPKLYLNPQI